MRRNGLSQAFGDSIYYPVLQHIILLWMTAVDLMFRYPHKNQPAYLTTGTYC